MEMATKQTTVKTTSMLMMMMMMVGMVKGHGMVIDPPQRSSMWRYGYPASPRNYNDNQLFCGGFATQWRANGGKCGICGDPYDGKRENEAGGRFATGVIVKTYRQADVIDVAVKITANHMGYFVFKLCPNNNVKEEATQKCLDQHVLKFVGPNGEDLGEKYYINSLVNVKHVRLQLPMDVTCSQCVLQWTYNTGNSWGCNNGIKDCCVGCGPQENFVNCIDIAITDNPNAITNAPVETEKPKETESPTAWPTTSTSTSTRTTVTMHHRTTKAAPTSTKKPEDNGSGQQDKHGCHAVGVFAGVGGMDKWCQTNCRRTFCPAAYCACS